MEDNEVKDSCGNNMVNYVILNTSILHCVVKYY